VVGEIDPGVQPQPPAVTDNREAHQFELTVDGQTAVLIYERRPHALALVHTEVPPALRGRGLATRLAEAAVNAARTEGLQVIAICPFVRAFLRKQHRSNP
jgi:predicted GNAT family acetyltransferase